MDSRQCTLAFVHSMNRRVHTKENLLNASKECCQQCLVTCVQQVVQVVKIKKKEAKSLRVSEGRPDTQQALKVKGKLFWVMCIVLNK